MNRTKEPVNNGQARAAAARTDAPADEVQRRLAQLQQAGEQALGMLGETAQSGQQAMVLLENISAATRELSAVNTELVPAIHEFSSIGKPSSWFERFVGDDLARKARFGSACNQLEALAEAGNAHRTNMQAIQKVLSGSARGWRQTE